MDFDFDLKKPTEFGDEIAKSAGDATKKIAQEVDQTQSQLLDFLDDEMKRSPGSTEDFEHVDPTPLVSQSASDKINKQVDESAGHFDDFLASTKTQFDNVKNDFDHDFTSFGSNVAKAGGDLLSGFESKIHSTLDFMNAERGHVFKAPEPAQTKPVPEPTFHDDEFEDNDSPSLSYNPSPAKKNPVTALKEQDSDKFISSEDLLSDFKEERTATPDFVPTSQSSSSSISSQNPPPVKEDLSEIKPEPVHSTVEEIVKPDSTSSPAPVRASPVEEAKPVEKPKPAPIPTPVEPKKKASIDSAKGPSIVSVEEIFYKYGLDAWFKPDRLHPLVESLIYWRDVKKSGIVFGAGLVTLLAVSCFSVISVIAYLSLISLSGAIAFRIYKTILAAVQKTSEGHPFKEYLEIDLTLSQDKVQQIASVAVAHVNGFTSELRRLFLVEDLVDSLKFGVILWMLTYIGAWFNGMTLVILAFVSLFTLPKVYENNKQSIDTYLDLVRSKLTEITDKVKAAIPIGKKPVESDKDK